MKKAKVMKIVRITIFSLLSLALILLITAVIIFRNELRTLASLKKVDDYGMYQMTYYGCPVIQKEPRFEALLILLHKEVTCF